MATEVDLPVEQRIIQLLQHLGIQQAHFAARGPADWSGLASTQPEVIASLTLVCPNSLSPNTLRALSPRLLVFTGDRGATAEAVQRTVTSLPDATLVILRDYLSLNWADAVADRTGDIGSAMLDLLSRMDQLRRHRAVPLTESEGEWAGISYRIEGSGPPLVLLPLALAPSQWDPLVPRLSQHYCTITLGGAELGMVATLETRACAGYLVVVRNLMEEVQLRPGESILDVGCGSGVYDRWLARRTGGANRIVGVDINRYLLREATALAKKEGLEGAIEFQEGDAEALPFPDSSFDVTMSVTVMEEVDADRMLPEMVRVTKPGGRVAVVVRAMDMPWLVNLPFSAELKAKVEAPGGGMTSGVGELGCADASLYRRFHHARLTKVKMFPQLGAFDRSVASYLQDLQARLIPTLSPEEANEWQAAVARAEAELTFFIAMPLHCAVGTKP